MERKTNIGQECSFTFSTSFIQRSTRSLFSQLQQFLILQNFWVNISHGLIDSLFYVYTQMVKISTSMEFPSLAVSQSCHLPSTVCLIWWPSGPLPLLMKCRSLSGTLSKQAIFLEVYFCRAESTQTLIGCLGINIMCRHQCSDQSEARICASEFCLVRTLAISRSVWHASTNQDSARQKQHSTNFTWHLSFDFPFHETYYSAYHVRCVMLNIIWI